ncbi:MAG TPA: hypothetical protein VGB73_12545 [Pyrinomonadaceae bacterium]|jgi:hypothetical protein
MMKLTPQHLSFARLADLAEGRLSADEQRATGAHLSECERCSAQLARLEQTIALMRGDASEAAPRDALAQVVGLFRERADARRPSALRRLLAVLSFDSAQLAPAYGVRSAQAGAARQMLYSAGEDDLDLRVSHEDDGWVVSGQWLGENVEGRVELSGAERTESAALDEQSEFTLPPVPEGTYTLRLRLKDAEVEVEGLELRSRDV